jgi:flagellar FliJ protein
MFQFRLAPLLRLREAEEEKRKQALAEALSRRDQERGRLAAVKTERDRCRQRLVREGAAMDFRERSLFGGYFDRLARQAEGIQQEIETAEAEVARRQGELAEAARDRQILERLRERRRTAHHRAELRRELTQLDELAVLGFGRRRIEEERECKST